MTPLALAQTEFVQDVGRLIAWVYEHPTWALTFGEAQRPPEVAAIYAAQGRGIAKSLHIDRLAIDLNLWMDGIWRPETEAHAPLGVYWEALRPSKNRWGGRFKKPDGGHYERNII